MSIKPQTLETLAADQADRIARALAPEGSNSILDWINDINGETPKNH